MNGKVVHTFVQDTWCIAKDTYATWIKYWWWFIAVRLAAGYFLPYLNILSTPFLVAGFWHEGIASITLSYDWILGTLFVLAAYATLLISAKPIIPKQHIAFMHYSLHAIVMTICFGIITFLYWSGRELVKFLNMPDRLAIVLLGTGAIIIGLYSLFLLISLFELEKIAVKNILKLSYTTIKNNLVSILIVGVVFVVGYAFLYVCSVYLLKQGLSFALMRHIKEDMSLEELGAVNRMFFISLDFAHKYVVAFFDMFIALPYLIIAATNIYYKKRDM